MSRVRTAEAERRRIDKQTRTPRVRTRAHIRRGCLFHLLSRGITRTISKVARNDTRKHARPRRVFSPRRDVAYVMNTRIRCSTLIPWCGTDVRLCTYYTHVCEICAKSRLSKGKAKRVEEKKNSRFVIQFAANVIKSNTPVRQSDYSHTQRNDFTPPAVHKQTGEVIIYIYI